MSLNKNLFYLMSQVILNLVCFLIITIYEKMYNFTNFSFKLSIKYLFLI